MKATASTADTPQREAGRRAVRHGSASGPVSEPPSTPPTGNHGPEFRKHDGPGTISPGIAWERGGGRSRRGGGTGDLIWTASQTPQGLRTTAGTMVSATGHVSGRWRSRGDVLEARAGLFRGGTPRRSGLRLGCAGGGCGGGLPPPPSGRPVSSGPAARADGR